MNPAEFPIQTFLIELNHHFQNVDHPGFSGMLQDMISQPPSPNPQLEAKTPYFKKELDQSIQNMTITQIGNPLINRQTMHLFAAYFVKTNSAFRPDKTRSQIGSK